MPIKTSSRKAKGRNLQKYIVETIRRIFKDLLLEYDVLSRTMGEKGIDIMLSPHAQVCYPFSIEAKNTKTFPSLSALKQSKANKYNGSLPGVVWHPPGKSMCDSIIYFNFKEFTSFWEEDHHVEYPPREPKTCRHCRQEYRGKQCFSCYPH